MPGLENVSGYASSTKKHIQIPLELPTILKEYTKAVLRSQPDDIISFSASYFHKMAGNETKSTDMSEIVDTPDTTLDLNMADSIAITNEHLQKFCDRYNGKVTIPYADLEKHWSQLGLSRQQLNEFFSVGEFYGGSVNWPRFCGLVCGCLTNDLNECMRLFLQQMGKISYEQFEDVYTFMVEVDGEISPDAVRNALDVCTDIKNKNDGKLEYADLTNEVSFQ